MVIKSDHSYKSSVSHSGGHFSYSDLAESSTKLDGGHTLGNQLSGYYGCLFTIFYAHNY